MKKADESGNGGFSTEIFTFLLKKSTFGTIYAIP